MNRSYVYTEQINGAVKVQRTLVHSPPASCCIFTIRTIKKPGERPDVMALALWPTITVPFENGDYHHYMGFDHIRSDRPEPAT